MWKKIIGIFVCMLLIFSVLPVYANVIFDRIYDSTMFGNTLYVGGSGPGNYSSIQDAIDDASDGYIVYVFDDNSPYYESLVINKSITLFGEDKYTTIIDSKDEECCINITEKFVSVSGFTLKNEMSGFNRGITIGSNCKNVVISNNIIKDTNRGIYINGGCRNIIDGNIIMDIISAIDIRNYANNNTISNNTIEKSNYNAIVISHFSSHNTVTRNYIRNWIISGIELYGSNENNIFLNSIEFVNDNSVLNTVLDCINSLNNTINKNNFIKGGFNCIFSVNSNNIWNGNYWGKGRILPKFIPVNKYALGFWIPLDFDVDWHPAKEPYDIPEPT